MVKILKDIERLMRGNIIWQLLVDSDFTLFNGNADLLFFNHFSVYSNSDTDKAYLLDKINQNFKDKGFSVKTIYDQDEIYNIKHKNPQITFSKKVHRRAVDNSIKFIKINLTNTDTNTNTNANEDYNFLGLLNITQELHNFYFLEIL